MSATHPTARSARLGFTDAARDEVVLDDLELTGELPEWLTGSLLRTGPARWDLPGGTVNHWFDGLAQLHRFSFRDGAVSYGSRFLRSAVVVSNSRTLTRVATMAEGATLLVRGEPFK